MQNNRKESIMSSSNTYTIHIVKNSPYKPYGISIDMKEKDDKIFSYHEEDNLLSIELNTKDEHLTAEIISLCKTISENFAMLDDILNTL